MAVGSARQGRNAAQGRTSDTDLEVCKRGCSDHVKCIRRLILGCNRQRCVARRVNRVDVGCQWDQPQCCIVVLGF